MFRMSLREYVAIRRANGLAVPILIHLNDETPWTSSDDDTLDVINTYISAPLALRNYYYDATNADSLYYPVGAGQLSYVAQLRANAAVTSLPAKTSNERTFICGFAGRMEYKHSASDGAGERAELMQVLKGSMDSESSPCYAVFSDVQDHVPTHGLNYNAYFNVMRESIFAPCPGGNNPETFRHYEVTPSPAHFCLVAMSDIHAVQALELGTIPLLVKIKRPERDFLSSMTF